MGGLAGIARWDDAPIPAAHLARMVRAATHRGPDGAPSRIGERIALAHLRFGTSGDAADPQPLVDRGRGLWFVFDGRLDNREELLAGIPSAHHQLSDAALAFAAFSHWGDHAAAHLLGDFAFIAWDDARRRLVCARDHLGIRHLHYFASPALFACGTDIAQVLAHPDVPREPDSLVAADYLAGSIRNGASTLYRGVCRIPPGHVLIGQDGVVRLERYWSAEPAVAIRYRRDEEYAAHCRDLLTRSVQARLRSDRRPAAMLSGGLDSSSVVCIAHRVVASAEPPRPFSMIYPGHPESDERLYIDAVAQHCGTVPVHVVPGPITARELDRQAREWSATPSMPADEMASTLYSAIASYGHRVALTGAGGDFLFSGSLFQYADLLRQLRPIAAVRRFIDDRDGGETGASRRSLVQAGVWPLLPRRAKEFLRPLARRAAGIEARLPWLLLERRPDEAFPDAPRGGSYATEDVTRQLGSGMHSFFVECAERAAAQHGIELRHPLLDARLVQFALDIPDGQRKRGRFTKAVLRDALGDDLPDIVRYRKTKGDFAHAIAEAVESLGGERFFSTLTIARAGWVDGAAITEKYRQMQAGYALGSDVYGDHVPSLWMITAVELWFRSAFGDAGADAIRPEREVAAPALPLY